MHGQERATCYSDAKLAINPETCHLFSLYMIRDFPNDGCCLRQSVPSSYPARDSVGHFSEDTFPRPSFIPLHWHTTKKGIPHECGMPMMEKGFIASENNQLISQATSRSRSPDGEAGSCSSGTYVPLCGTGRPRRTLHLPRRYSYCLHGSSS